MASGKKANSTSTMTLAVTSNPAHSTITGSSATLGMEYRKVTYMSSAVSRAQKQAGGDPEDGGDGQAEQEHHQARGEVLPQLSAGDHLDAGGHDFGGHGEEGLVDARADDLPGRQHDGQREALDEDGLREPALTFRSCRSLSGQLLGKNIGGG